MEILFELIFEFVFQIVGEVLAEAGFRGAARLLSNRWVRMALGLVLAVGGGYLFGHWWGVRASEPGDTDVPTSFWVSTGLALAFGVLALRRLLDSEPPIGRPVDSWRSRLIDALQPWAWSSVRLLGFMLLNASLAVGIAMGYTPHPALT